MRPHRRKRALTTQIKAILLLGAFFFALGAAHASPLREQCLASPNIDTQHACACDNIKQESFIDPAPFSLERSDLKRAFETVAVGTSDTSHSALIDQLKNSYEKERNNLYCHNETIAEIMSFAVSEPYCYLNPTNSTQIACTTSTSMQDQMDYKLGKASSELLAAESRLNEKISKYFGGVESLSVCEEHVNIKSLEKVGVIKPYCKIDLEAKFMDNIYELDSKTRSSISDAIKNDSCFKRNEHISRVEIISSSSLFANTGSASKLTFLDLSRLRAEAVLDIISNDFSVSRGLITLNYNGTNKGAAYAGTSGPCPYQYDAIKDRWDIKQEFKSGEKNLNEHKKVTLNVYFDEARSGVNNPEAHRAIFKKCARVKFKCAD